PQGEERLYLHMGYFATLAEAQVWSQRMRGTYPNAIASAASSALLRQHDSGVPTLSAASGRPSPRPSTSALGTSAKDSSLSDTQVIRILETRHVGPVKDATAAKNSSAISLLGP